MLQISKEELERDAIAFARRVDEQRTVAQRPPPPLIQSESVMLHGRSVQQAIKKYLTGGTNSNTNDTNRNV